MSLLNSNKAKFERESKLKNVLQHWDVKKLGSKDLLATLLGNKQDAVAIEFEKAISELGNMESKIELLKNLYANSERIHFSMAIYADTPTNIHITHE